MEGKCNLNTTTQMFHPILKWKYLQIPIAKDHHIYFLNVDFIPCLSHLHEEMISWWHFRGVSFLVSRCLTWLAPKSALSVTECHTNLEILKKPSSTFAICFLPVVLLFFLSLSLYRLTFSPLRSLHLKKKWKRFWVIYENT